MNPEPTRRTFELSYNNKVVGYISTNMNHEIILKLTSYWGVINTGVVVASIGDFVDSVLCGGNKMTASGCKDNYLCVFDNYRCAGYTNITIRAFDTDIIAVAVCSVKDVTGTINIPCQ